jgi:hypothetical protein
MLPHDEDTKDILSSPELAAAARAVSGLSVPNPPADLAARTHARVVSSCAPFKRVFWLLRPITHPVARLAAAAVIIFGLAPLADLDAADIWGRRIEERIIGRKMADRIEGMVDNMLVINGVRPYSQYDLDALMGVNTPVIRKQSRALRREV